VSILGTTGTSPIAITIDSAGNLYTANMATNNISKVTPAGVSTILGTLILQPKGIAVDTAGNIYTVANDQVFKITPTGVVTAIANTGLGTEDITIDSVGNIYTANRGSNTITRIATSGGSFLTVNSSGEVVMSASTTPAIVTSDPRIGSIATDSIPKWNGSSLVTSTLTESGSNVGIGTTTPTEKLDVVGNARISGTLSVATPVAPTHAATKAYVDAIALAS
jgi:Beta-propeller repeat